MPKQKSKRKPVNFKLLDPANPVYELMRNLIQAHHAELSQARIALAWRLGWNPDKDHRLVLGQCRKASDLDRELREYDAVILLNQDVWDEFTLAQQRALLDHELCHLRVARDSRGDLVIDERGRVCYRIRKHDLEEFREVVVRHGTYKADLVAFAQALQNTREHDTPLFEDLKSTTDHKVSVTFKGEQTPLMAQIAKRLNVTVPGRS